MRGSVDLAELHNAEQDARWRRSLVLQWLELEGFTPSLVLSCESLPNGRVLVTHHVANAMGRPVENDGKPITTTSKVKPSTTPPWTEWME